MAVGSIEGATMGSSVAYKLGASEDCPRWCSLGDGGGMLGEGEILLSVGYAEGYKEDDSTLGTNDGSKLDSIEGIILEPVNGKPLGTLDVAKLGTKLENSVGCADIIFIGSADGRQVGFADGSRDCI